MPRQINENKTKMQDLPTIQTLPTLCYYEKTRMFSYFRKTPISETRLIESYFSLTMSSLN